MLLMDEDFQKDLRAAATPEDFLAVIDEAESRRVESEEKEPDEPAGGIEVAAVTACPTGIAHTYMAAEALEKAAMEAGIRIKVETRGSGGVKNLLTEEEIAQAKGIITACDAKVPMERFDGKRVLDVRVADGIHKADQLLETILNGDVPPYHAGSREKDSEAQPAEAGGVGHQLYTHLMSGVSHMLPFVIGGGILTALAFLLDTLMGYGDIGSAFGSATPLSALLKYIGGLAMGLMVPVLAGYIAYSIADRPGLAVGFVGGLLASGGNALAADYAWSGQNAFMDFVRRFAFVADGGGNTVSGFLGGIAAGFLAGFVVLGLKKLTEKLPDALDGIRPTLIYPLCGILIVGLLMCFLLNPLIGLINTGLSNMLAMIADSGMLWLLGLILGAMMAIDMGGPINKAAYVFGIGVLATASELVASGASTSDPKVTACYIAMAAIMVGGMVPPVGIALACWFFPKKFTAAERETKISNIVMGCAFITEGAIPFAAADPLHVIPCTMVGAGVAGLLSALFGCTLMAPHGGIFVFATVGNPLLYILAWLAGSAVTCLMLGMLKKDAAKG